MPLATDCSEYLPAGMVDGTSKNVYMIVPGAMLCVLSSCVNA